MVAFVGYNFAKTQCIEAQSGEMHITDKKGYANFC